MMKLHPIDGDIKLDLLRNLPPDPNAYKRNFIYEQRFAFGVNSDSKPKNEFMNPSMGVFIVGHSNLDPDIREVVEKYKVKFNEGLSCIDTIAKYNMTDIAIYRQFREDLIEKAFKLDSLPDVKLSRFHSEPSRGPKSVKVNCNDHYNSIYLSHIIQDFTQFGTEHVNKAT